MSLSQPISMTPNRREKAFAGLQFGTDGNADRSVVNV